MTRAMTSKRLLWKTLVITDKGQSKRRARSTSNDDSMLREHSRCTIELHFLGGSAIRTELVQ